MNRAGRAKLAGLSFLIVNLGVPGTLRLNSPVLLRGCPKCVVVLFKRWLPHYETKKQARNQLGTPRGEEFFESGPNYSNYLQYF